MIVKENLSTNFTIISNDIVRSKDLSINAKMLAVLLCSLPKDWIVNNTHLSKELGISPRTLQRAFKELVSLNFIKKMQVMDKGTKKFTRDFAIVFVGKDEAEINEPLSVVDESISQNEGENLEVDISQNAGQNERNLNAFSADEKEASKEEQTPILKDFLDERAVKMTALSEVLEGKEALNHTSSSATNSRRAGFCRTYINKEFLQSKNSFLMANFARDVYLIFEKKKLKKENLDFSFFNALEKEKINEWFKYKSIKKPLNVLTKQKILKQLKDFKAHKQDICKVIEQSILRGWQGLFYVKNKQEKKPLQTDILKEVLSTYPNFDFSTGFDLSALKIEGKRVKYNPMKDEFNLV